MVYTMTNKKGYLPTRADKKRFIRQLAKSVTKEIIANIPKMPAEWDGAELRQYVADKYTDAATGWGPMFGNRKRMRDYRNTIATATL